MTCPQCGREMKPGRLYCRAPLLWSSKRRKWTIFPGKEDVSLTGGGFPTAWICKSCRRVIVAY